jgi:hypothetical protein
VKKISILPPPRGEGEYEKEEKKKQKRIKEEWTKISKT